jgi:hypothetical protein
MSEDKKYLDTEESDNSKSIVVNTDEEGEQGVYLDLEQEDDNAKEVQEDS